MKKEIEAILEELEESGTSAGLTVADHIRTVASNGPEYRTPDAISEEASAIVGWAMKLDKPLQNALTDARIALVGDYSSDDEHDALVAIVKALGEGGAPECLEACASSLSAPSVTEETKKIWKERIDNNRRLGLCIGALEGLRFQVPLEIREKIDSVIAEARK